MHALTKTKFLAATAMLVLTACSITDPTVGTGPIALGAAAEKAFADYQGMAYPRYFAVAEDGGAFYYSYCSAGRCPRTPKTQIVRQCETYSDGVPCKIYASNGNIVWADGS